MRHLTDQELSAYLDGAFKGRDAEEAGRHLATCQPCREALAELAAQDESLKPVLAHDPGEAYFESFASRVEARIGARGGAPARAAGVDPGRWFRSPRTLAWAGGLAVVVVGGGLALMTSREVVPPDLRDRDRAARVERAAPSDANQPTPGKADAAPPATTPGETGPSAAPGSAGLVGEEVPAVEAPDLPAEREGTTALRSRLQRPAPGVVPMAKDEAAATEEKVVRQASPGRATEVRLNEAGEEMPVRRPAERRAAPAPAPVTAGEADRAAQVRKKLAAEPLDAVKPSTPTQALGATGARRDSAPREYSFAPPPPGPATMNAFKQGAPARGVEGEARLCGDVRDAADRPIAGAQVVLSGLGRSTTTNAAGRFCIAVPRGEHSLSVMAVGYQESRPVVRVEGAEADTRVTLEVVPVLGDRGAYRVGRAAPGRTEAEPQGKRAAETLDDYSALPDTLRWMVRGAQRLEDDAAARRSAGHYDLAAGAWERVLGRLSGGPLENATRRHLAETRYHAWEIGPNPRRARAAVEALTGYATRAPAGPERDQAARWLEQVRR